jgi:hypothetical protein
MDLATIMFAIPAAQLVANVRNTLPPQGIALFIEHLTIEQLG